MVVFVFICYYFCLGGLASVSGSCLFTGRGKFGHGFGPISEPALLNVYRLIPPTNTQPT